MSDNTHTEKGNSSPDNESKLTRRKSDATLLGMSSHELNDKIYSLEFGVNLSLLTLEGLTHYSVAISCFDKNSQQEQKLSSSLEVSLTTSDHKVQIEGGPPIRFSVSEKTHDLEELSLEDSIVNTVNQGVSWLKGEPDSEWVKENRRQVPEALLNDAIAVNLLMSSISTIIAGSVFCHRKVISNQKQMFESRDHYIKAMVFELRAKLDDFTHLAIHRGVQLFVASS